MLPPTVYLVGSAALAGALLAGGGVYKVMSWRCDATRTEAVERVIEQMQEQARLDDEISSRFESDKVKIKVVFRDLEGAVDATPGPSSLECKFPTAWVWAWHAANRGAYDPASKPDAGMPYPTYPDRRGTEDAVPEPYSGGAGVSRVSSEAQGPDNVGKGWFE